MSKKTKNDVEEEGSEPEEEYFVEKILDKRIMNGKVFLLIDLSLLSVVHVVSVFNALFYNP